MVVQFDGAVAPTREAPARCAHGVAARGAAPLGFAVLGNAALLCTVMLLMLYIAGARPNFMKVAPIIRALESRAAQGCALRYRLIHTGQHYDPNMSDAFFRDLGMPTPHFHLEVGSGSHAEQLGGVMIAYEKVALREKPDWIIVVGDVNSTAACALPIRMCTPRPRAG